MRRALLVLASVAACGGDDEPLPTGPITARVTHYDFRFDVESRAAHAKLTLALDAGGDCVTLPFRAQDLAGAMLDGAPAAATIVDDNVQLCGAGYRQGTTIVAEVDAVIPLATLGPSQVGYSLSQDTDGNPFYYLVSWVGGCDRFGPCDHRPNRFATYHFTVTHPAAFEARCPGTITEVSATETRCAFDQPGGPTYSTFGVAVYPAWSLKTDKGTWGGVKVTVYDREGTNMTARIDADRHGGFLSWLQSELGPYPYGDELRILVAPTYWNGFEHPGNIVLDDRLAKAINSSYADQVQHTLDHELAHMWAGDQTTLASTYDFVWKEAMAEYLTFVYEDMVTPSVARRTNSAWKQFSQNAMYYPVPEDQPALFDYYGHVYGPGPMVLFRQLEAMTSRAQVLAALKALLGQPRAIGVDDVLAALETSTGLDLAAYADGWIRGSGAPNWPRYQVTFTPGGGTSTLALVQTNPGPVARGCKFHVALRGAGTDELQLVSVDTFTGGVDQSLTVTTPEFEVTSLVLDPDGECLVYRSGGTPRTVTPFTHPWVSERAGWAKN
jgi:aminopeptidase N